MDDNLSAGRAVGGAIKVACLLLFAGCMAVLTGAVGLGHDPAPELPATLSVVQAP